MLPEQQRVQEVISRGCATISNSAFAALALGFTYCRTARLTDCSVTRDHLIALARRALTTSERHLKAAAFENCSDALETAERLRYEIGQLVPHVVQDNPTNTTPDRQQLYAAIVESCEDAIITKDLKGVIKSWNSAAQQMFGYTEEEATGQPITIIIPPDLRNEEKRILKKLEAGERIENYETRRVTKDGKTIYVSLTISPVRDAEGKIIGASKFARDITNRKLTEEMIVSSVNRKLIEAHEEERTRIARELHDGISQQIALLVVNLEHLKDCFSSAPELNGQVGELQKQVVDLGSDVQALSHGLHSSKLEYLGLVAACKGFIAEFSGRQRVRIDSHFRDIPKTVPPEVGLCLFRVLQEALGNGFKHSGAQEIHVVLTGGANEIKLVVQDSGIGFDPEDAIKGPGLGLTSMKERLKLVHGELSIESQLRRGTTVRARAPLGNPHSLQGLVGQ